MFVTILGKLHMVDLGDGEEKFEGFMIRLVSTFKNRDASVMVKNTWTVVEEKAFPRLGKLSLPSVHEPDDLIQCGALEYSDKIWDRVNIKNEKTL